MKLNGSFDFFYKNVPASLKTLETDEVTPAYIDGLNGEDRFLETTPNRVTMKGQQAYVDEILQDPDKAICGLWCDGELAGTAGVQNLSAAHTEGVTIGIFIFNERFLGKGWGKVLVWAISQRLLQEEHIHTIRAAAKVENIPSKESFLRVGFDIVSNDGTYNHMQLAADQLLKPDEVRF